jgi:hypothetical protein
MWSSGTTDKTGITPTTSTLKILLKTSVQTNVRKQQFITFLKVFLLVLPFYFFIRRYCPSTMASNKSIDVENPPEKKRRCYWFWSFSQSAIFEERGEEKGCIWTGPVSRVRNHCDECPCITVPCSNDDCETRMKRSNLVRHLSVCPKRKLPCCHCGELTPADALDTLFPSLFTASVH